MSVRGSKMASTINKQYQKRKNIQAGPKKKKLSTTTTMSGNSQTKAIRKMIRLGHSVLVAREHLKGKRSFESFESLESLHKWMTTLPDASRNLYHVDLSNAGTSTKNELSQVELTYISQFVSPLTNQTYSQSNA
jgi:hypothetical protein